MAYSRPLKRHRDDAGAVDDCSWHCVQCEQENSSTTDTCYFCTTNRDAYKQLQAKLIKDHHLAELVRLPSHWKCNAREVFVQLHDGEPEFAQVAQQIKSSGLKWKSVTGVRRVENHLLYRIFQLQKHDLMHRIGPEINEMIVYHGAALQVLEKICEEGFNVNFASDDGLYGKAVYVAIQAGVSAWLRYAKRDKSGEQHILCCQVLAGRWVKGEVGLLEAPKLPSHLGSGRYDAVTDDDSQPTLFGLFVPSRIYPTHLVSLIKK